MPSAVVEGISINRSGAFGKRLLAPLALAAALRDGLGIDCLYLADLDAIEGRPPDLALLDDLAEEGLELWLDAGVRDRRALDAAAGPRPGFAADRRRARERRRPGGAGRDHRCAPGAIA